MTKSLCSCYQNHATLVSNVYPSGPGEEGPRGSALSLLLFYCSSKPQKLKKIGPYVEHRVETDIKKCRYGHVRLISECKQHTSLLSKSVLRIILHVLQCPDTDLVLLSTNTFVLYSSLRSQEDVIDTEFNLLHNQLVKKFCEAATNETTIISEKHKSRMSGLKALEALCEARYFVDGSKIDGNVENVLQSILANMRHNQKSSEQQTGVMVNHEGKRPSIADQLITDNELSQTAEKCLAAIFQHANASTLKTLITTVIKILDEAGHLNNAQYLLEILPLVITNSETQYHFVIISTILEKLGSESRIQPKTTFVSGLAFLIGEGKLAGVTIPELLETCVKHMKLTTSNQELDEDEKSPLLQELITAIGTLASHLAYPEQVNEIVSFLANRLQTSMSNSIQVDHFSECILEALSEVITRPVNSSKRFSVQPSVLSFGLLSPLAPLLVCPAPEIRLSVYNLFSRALMVSRMDHRPNEAREEFCDAIRNSIYALVAYPDSIPADFVISGNLLISILSLHSFKELGVVIPLLFQLLDKCYGDSTMLESRKRALSSMIVEYFLFASEFLSLSGLNAYIKQIKSQRLENHEWCPGIELSDEALNVLQTKDFSETESGMSLKPVEDRIKRNVVIDLISKELNRDNTEELKQLEHAWSKDFVSGELEDSTNKLQRITTEKKSYKKPLTHKRSVSVKSTSSKTENPQIKISISAFKEALNQKQTNPALDDEAAPHVNELLKSITSNFSRSSIKVEAQELKNVSRKTTPTFVPKRREPTIFDLNEDSDGLERTTAGLS